MAEKEQCCDVPIARRDLEFSKKGNSVRHRLTVEIYPPNEVEQAEVRFEVSPGTASCRVEFEGLDEPAHVVYGADTLQALELAVNIDPVLRGMEKRYDFFFPTGEGYFDE